MPFRLHISVTDRPDIPQQKCITISNLAACLPNTCCDCARRYRPALVPRLPRLARGGHTACVPQTVKENPRVVASIPFVEQLARRVAATMPHSIDIGDLVQDGVIGLIDAAHRFDEARGIKFETFAERRIRGAMIDALRKDAWPRGVRRQRRELEAAREELRRELGCEPSLADLAAKVGSDEKRLGRTIVRINAIESTSPLANNDHARRIVASRGARFRPNPSSRTRPTSAHETTDRVRDAIASLPPREQKVIGLYYYGEATMKQIGAEIGVNESRVSQLHARAIRRLRDALGALCPAPKQRSVMRSAILEFQQSRRWRRPRSRAEARRTAPVSRAAGVVVAYRERLAHGAQQVAESERLGEPAAAAVLEEALGVGAGHVAGDEDDATSQRRGRRRDGTVERHPVDARHLQIADDHVVGVLPHAGEGLLAVARVIHLKPASRALPRPPAASARSSSTSSTALRL